MLKPQLSAFIVCRDAAVFLPHVIANLRRCCDEVLVAVDPQSRDGTLAVAQQYADLAWHPEHDDWLPNSARNEAAGRCRGQWLLMLDDDELLPPALLERIPQLMHSGFQECAFQRRNLVGDGSQWITSAPWWPDWQVRLRSRMAWEAQPWPRETHGVPPAFSRLSVATSSLWHLKFVVKPPAQRAAVFDRWSTRYDATSNAHYRQFALYEDYAWQTAAVDEAPPAELVGLLAAVGTTDEERING